MLPRVARRSEGGHELRANERHPCPVKSDDRFVVPLGAIAPLRDAIKGETMRTATPALQLLTQARTQVVAELARIDAALLALNGGKRRGRPPGSGKRKRGRQKK